MKIKTIDQGFDICLWIVFFVLVVGFWFLTKSISAPDFEVVNSDVQYPYEYTKDDGERVKSVYYLAWKHEQFSKPKVVIYDPTNGNWKEFKDEYVEKYKVLMPESQYSFWQRCFWVFLVVFVILSALATVFIGGFIRDTVLYGIVKMNNSFSDCAYFLYYDRFCFKKQASDIMLRTIDDYMLNKKEYLYKKYVASFADLIMNLLLRIKAQKTTKVKFYYSYLDNTKQHTEYLKDLSLYWQSQIGKNADAEKNQEFIDAQRQKKYVNFNINASASDFSYIVSSELKKLFVEVMGEEVFNFEACSGEYASAVKIPGVIFVTTTVENSLNTFTWSGKGYLNEHFPGVAVRFTIYHYLNGQKKILWNKYLKPKCTYKAKEDALVISDLYKNMVEETIRSFPESLKSDKA